MNKNKLNLCGTWQCHMTDGAAHTYDIPASVPGCVHTDLQAAGILGDLFWRTENDTCQWVENCDVTYRRTFSVDTVHNNTDLTFEGLDVYCSVWLNGVCIGEADDMFRPWSYPVDGVLKTGENTLEIRFRSPIREVDGLPKRGGAFTTERLYTRRIQCTYGWDWVARFVTMGIWKPVYLETRTANRFRDVYVYTKDINAYAAQIAVRTLFADITGEAFADFTILDPDGQTVYTRTRKLLPMKKGDSDTTISFCADITDAQLWYPLGYGEQPLYTLCITVDGEEVSRTRFGIRTVVLLEIEDAPDSADAALAAKLKETLQLKEWDRNEGSSCFHLLVNGIRIFCTGANWVPCEPFPSAESDEKLRLLVRRAADGGYNMLRVWGGGIFEHDAFYDACDEMGVLVTQDFLMACGQYPEEDDSFIEKLKHETESAALALRNHPCLAWWSGDNENAVAGDENMEHYSGRRAALEGIAPILRELDPARPFLPSSPYGGTPYASGVRGTTHNTQFLGTFFGWVRGDDLSDYREVMESYLSRFCAEQPALGMPYVSSLRRFMTEEDIFGDDVSVSEYHTKNNPGLGAITLYGYIDRMARGMFGEYRDGYDRIYKMQLLHCEWIRLMVELYRRHAWYSSGIIFWMFNDCWPAANSWSQVDYDGNPKPAYYTFRRTAKPVISSVTEEDGAYCVYASHRGTALASVSGRLCRYNIVTGEEEELCRTATVRIENESRMIASVPTDSVTLDREHILLFDLTSDAGDDRAYFLPLAFSKMAFASPTAEDILYTVTETEEAFIVTAKETIPVLMLDVPYVLSDNSMFLKRGECVTIHKQEVLSNG